MSPASPQHPDIAWPVRTERLSIRPATRDDADATWAYRRLESVARWLTSLPVDRDAYAERFGRDEALSKTLVYELDGQVIGDLMLSVVDPWAQLEVAEEAAGTQAEVGWVLDPAFGGRGLATEAAAGVLGICFDRLGLRRVVAGCFADNVASWRLMERLGMRREMHNVQESLHRSGAWLDNVGYAILAEEWRVRENSP